MQNYFNELTQHLTSKLAGDEVLLCSFSGEESDFIRFNNSLVRQPGRVENRAFAMELIQGNKHASADTTLTGVRDTDRSQLGSLLESLRHKLPYLPNDPHLLYNTEVQNTEQHGDNQLPPAQQMVEKVLECGRGADLAGILAAGGVFQGFANSLGQRNWFSSYNFNLDWSFHLRADKAVKAGYAGVQWDDDAFVRKVENARKQLDLLSMEPRTIPAGKYRVYLSPVALKDFVEMVAYEGFGIKSHRTKGSSLVRMIESGTKLHPAVTFSENTKEGVSPNFQRQGILKPDRVVLIDRGEMASPLVSPRSAKEYGVPANGANSDEIPESLDMESGDIPQAQILEQLDTGVWINNLWYLNYSDRPACRLTGMTRFACFWVEEGRVVAPLNVMRFDESAYRALGENLVGLTREREMLLDSDTYCARSTLSYRLPGALINGFNFNL